MKLKTGKERKLNQYLIKGFFSTAGNGLLLPAMGKMPKEVFMEKERLTHALRLLWENHGEDEGERPEYCAGLSDAILWIAASMGIEEREITEN